MTQNARLLNYLERNPHGLSQLEAFNTLGICRLSERVRELERLGYVVEHIAEKTAGGARVVRYKLIGEVRKTQLGNEYIGRQPDLMRHSEINDPTSWDAMVDA